MSVLKATSKGVPQTVRQLNRNGTIVEEKLVDYDYDYQATFKDVEATALELGKRLIELGVGHVEVQTTVVLPYFGSRSNARTRNEDGLPSAFRQAKKGIRVWKPKSMDERQYYNYGNGVVDKFIFHVKYEE